MSVDRINDRIVAPSADGHRNLGVARATLIRRDHVVQLYFADGPRGKFSRLVEKRITTAHGQTLEELFEPPVRESKLPPLPLAKLARNARLARLAGLGIDQRKKPKRRANDRRSRICRLREALNK